MTRQTCLIRQFIVKFRDVFFQCSNGMCQQLLAQHKKLMEERSIDLARSGGVEWTLSVHLHSFLGLMTRSATGIVGVIAAKITGPIDTTPASIHQLAKGCAN